ncbi:hypothetical protein [Desulfuromonas thiophila]|uniref:hypothetical protein n=1 Tax=Desulfuromonas thiophila TaxID=57664 RepID=UPI0029F527CC|nr:hypothetical protein [Desulfuromonas thiophila]
MDEFIIDVPVLLPDGRIGRPGETVRLSARQGKYLLLAGKIRPASSQKSAAKAKNSPAAAGTSPKED